MAPEFFLGKGALCHEVNNAECGAVRDVLCTFRDNNQEAFHQIYSKKERKKKSERCPFVLSKMSLFNLSQEEQDHQHSELNKTNN